MVSSRLRPKTVEDDFDCIHVINNTYPKIIVKIEKIMKKRTVPTRLKGAIIDRLG